MVVPLLTVSKSASDDVSAIQETFTHHDTETTKTAVADRRSAADEPVVIPDDQLIQSSSDQNDTIFQVSTNNSRQSPLSYPATAASATDIAETGYSAFSMNTTTVAKDFTDVISTHEPIVEEEEVERKNGSRVESSSGNLYLSHFTAKDNNVKH